jgi:hypothetical protein
LKKLRTAIGILVAAAAGLALLVGVVVGLGVWLFKGSFELHPVGATATFKESADCLVRYGNNFKGWRLDRDNVDFCFPTQTVAKEQALISCFNKYEQDHPDHAGWPERNMRGCTWDGLTAVPAPHVVSLVFGKVVAVPAVPRSGKRFVLKVGVTRRDSAAKAGQVKAVFDSNPAVDLAVTIDGRDALTGPVTPESVVPASYGFWPDDKIHVILTLPKAAAGKRMVIKMTIAADSPRAAKIVAFTVAP